MRQHRGPPSAWALAAESPLPSAALGAGATAASGAADGSAPARRRPRALAWLALARPRQWLKNLLVVAAPTAAGVLGHDDVPVRVLVACVAFCLIAAGIYALNDVHDLDEDRRHPSKRLRPVAAGEIEPRGAVRFGIAAIAAGLGLCVGISFALAGVGLAYLALTVSYSWAWRHVPVLDLVALAGGFVLRAVAGGVAAPVALSSWFLIVVSCAAVFVAAGKRLAEMERSTAAADKKPTRRVLRFYTVPALRRTLTASGAGALFAYGMWALDLPLVDAVPWRPLTVIPFAVCLLRYGFAVRRGDGDAPEELLLSDRWLLVGALAWVALFLLGIDATG